MMNYFNFNFGFPFGMNNWFMPNLAFSNFLPTFNIPIFNMNNNWFNSFTSLYNSNYTFNPFYSSSFSYPDIFTSYSNISNLKNNGKSLFYSVESKKPKTDSKTDSFEKTVKKSATEDLKSEGYNASKGEKLASIALNRSVGWTGYCARFVKNSIQAANMGSYQYGHAYQMPDILRNNGNFKEISTDGVDVSSLPAGCVLVYDRGAQGYNKKYGHTEITTGDGRAVSDGITKNLYKKPSSIFIPV